MKKIIIVGAGLSGVAAARTLAEAGYQVEIWEKREHIAGNMFDYYDEHGILVHKYGPHVFNTDDQKLYDFVNKFEQWTPSRLVCGASWDGKLSPTLFNFKTIDIFFEPANAEILKKKLLKAYPEQETVTILEMLENPDPDIKGFAEFLFKNDYAPYTAKQWNLQPDEIDPSVLKRVPIRLSYDEAYFSTKFEALPKHSYSEMFRNMLNHPNIKLKLKINALDHIAINHDI